MTEGLCRIERWEPIIFMKALMTVKSQPHVEYIECHCE